MTTKDGSRVKVITDESSEEEKKMRREIEEKEKEKNIILSNGFTFQLMNQHGNLNQI